MKTSSLKTGISYLISLGDSSEGPLGACIRVTLAAGSKPADAIAEVKKFLDAQNAGNGLELCRSPIDVR